MEVQDRVRWAAQEMELKTGDDTSRKFLEFFTAWFEEAERGHANRSDTVFGSGHPRPLMDSVRNAYVATELKLGYLSMEWIGQMLLIASEHWVHGPEMLKDMTVLEARMLEQMTAIKLVELQEAAAKL